MLVTSASISPAPISCSVQVLRCARCLWSRGVEAQLYVRAAALEGSERSVCCIVTLSVAKLCSVGPCHHGMARPQVADGGTASNMEGS